jgi:excisionase family DNA binding protein
MTLLGTKEAAEVLHIAESTLRNLVHFKRITYVKMGGIVRFRMDDLKEFIDRHVRTGRG